MAMTTSVNPIYVHLKARKFLSSGAIMLGGIMVVLYLSNCEVGLFSLVANGVTPVARLVTVLLGFAIGAPLMAGFETDYIATIRRDVKVVQIAIALSVASLVGVGLALLLREPNVWAVPRLIVFWTFITLISGETFGGQFSWLLPTVIAVVVALFSPPEATSAWNIIMSQANSLCLWSISAAAVLTGVSLSLR